MLISKRLNLSLNIQKFSKAEAIKGRAVVLKLKQSTPKPAIVPGAEV